MANGSKAATELPQMTGHRRRDHWFGADGGGWAQALEAAWPGIRVNYLRFHLDERRDTSELAGRLAISLSASGAPSAMTTHALVTQADLDSLPPCGSARRSGRSIQRSKSSGRVRVELSIHDNLDEDQGDFDLIVKALAPLIWKP